MNRVVALCGLIGWIVVWIVLTAAVPAILSDKNAFLKGFVNQELLAFMGVVVTITLTLAASFYLELTKLEDRFDRPVFRKTKENVRQCAFALVWLLFLSCALVVVKPLLPSDEHWTCVSNGAALTVVLMTILLLADIVQAAFNLDIRH